METRMMQMKARECFLHGNTDVASAIQNDTTTRQTLTSGRTTEREGMVPRGRAKLPSGTHLGEWCHQLNGLLYHEESDITSRPTVPPKSLKRDYK